MEINNKKFNVQCPCGKVFENFNSTQAVVELNTRGDLFYRWLCTDCGQVFHKKVQETIEVV